MKLGSKFTNLLRSSILKKFLENQMVEERTYFILTLITGISAAIVAVVLHKTTKYLTMMLGTNDSFSLRAFIGGGFALLISGYITTRKYPSTSGSGIPGVKIALAVYHGKITYRSTVAKFITSILSLSSGFSLGREGPTVAITSGIGSALGSFFHLSNRRIKSLVAIGSAGGIAAAFNTPIAAVVFTLEEVVGDLNAKMLGSIVISSVIASVVAQALQGNVSTFAELNYQLNDSREIILYAFVGLAAALIGTLWVNSVLAFRKWGPKIFRNHRLSLIMSVFVIIALVSYLNPQVLGSGHDTIENTLLSLILDWKVLLSLFAFKFIATTLCYGSGVSGGLFMPTLLMGATLGGLIGSIAKILFPELAANIGAFALIGMGAYFAAVIRSPFTSILLIFEMTRDYNIILPLMVANILAYLLAEKIHHGSIYENISEQDGIHLPSHEDNETLESLTIEDAMITNPITMNINMPIKDAEKKAFKNSISGYPVMDKGLMVGIVSSNEIHTAFAKRKCGISIIGDICTRNVIKLYPDQTLLVAFHKLKKYHISRLAVVSRLNDKHLLGIITAHDIVKSFGFHITEADNDSRLVYK